MTDEGTDDRVGVHFWRELAQGARAAQTCEAMAQSIREMQHDMAVGVRRIRYTPTTEGDK